MLVVRAVPSSMHHRLRRSCAALSLMAIMGLAVGCSDSPQAKAPAEATPVEPRSFELSIVDRAVSLEGDAIRVSQGERAEIRWVTDEATAIHLHGYDIEISLEPGRPSTMSFEANASGRFPITSHGFEAPKQAAPAHEHEHDHGEHEHGEHEHGAQAAQEGDHGEVTLLYFEVYPR